MRQFITKALEIRRSELAKVSSNGGDPRRSAPGYFQDLKQTSPRRLTFYDVVQLARQQALVEKTRRANEDLIDLSDIPSFAIDSVTSTDAQGDYDLLDLDETTISQQDLLSLSSRESTEPSQPFQAMEPSSNQPVAVELEAGSCKETPLLDLQELVELPTAHSHSIDEKLLKGSSPSLELLRQPMVELSDTTLTDRHELADSKPTPIELDNSTMPRNDNSSTEVADGCCTSRTGLDQPSVASHQFITKLIDNANHTDEAITDDSPPGTVASSIFSHSSSLTNATSPSGYSGYSLSSITEEEIQARISSSQAASMISFSTPRSLPPLVSRMACLSTSDSSTHVGLPLAPTTLGTLADDSISLIPSLPQPSDLDKPDQQGFPWIVQSARDGDEQMIQRLLSSGADIEALNTSTERCALSEAALQGHERVVDLLISEGCLLESKDADGNTALHYAARKGNLAVAKSLVQGGASVSSVGPQGQTPLHLAMKALHQNVVMLLIQHRADVNARDASYQTPLHIAAMLGNTTMCNHLLNEGAQLDSREAQSKTPLHLACEAGHYDLAQMMLDYSMLNPTSMTFLTAFFAAVEHGHVRICESFFSHGLKLRELRRDSYKPLTLAAKSGCLAIVDLMIQEDCDTDARDEKGWNALHFASYHGHYQIIEQLIASNVSAKANTSRKETPLLIAVKGAHFAVAERLLRSDSSLLDIEDEQCQQPVHHAARAGSIEIFNLLLSNGGKINGETRFGWRPIHVAIAYGHDALVERLLQEGANIEEKLGSTSVKKDQTHKTVEEGYWAEARWPYHGSRPLHLACEYRHDQIASYLISKGAKMETTCSEGWQPLHLAAYFGSSTLVEMLLSGGVNVYATTNEGKTAQALQFCTSGAPILEEDKDRIAALLTEAMDKGKKQKSFKVRSVALKRGSTAEEKNNLVRAAMFSMGVTSRPPLHRASATAQALVHKPKAKDPIPTSHRPQLNRLSQTSPLPLTRPLSEASVRNSFVSGLVVHQEEEVSPPIATPVSSNVETSSKPPTSETLTEVPTVANSADQTLPPSNKELVPIEPVQQTARPSPAFKRRATFGLIKSKPVSNPSTTQPSAPSSSSTDLTLTTTTTTTTAESATSDPPEPKLKRRSTAFGLTKVKPSGVTLDIGKLSLGNMGKPAFDLGKQTVELGNKTLELGKQGIEMSKQGLERSRHGSLEAFQGGLGMGKTGYKKAKKRLKMKGKGKGGAIGEKGEVDGNVADAKADGGGEDEQLQENDDHDDDLIAEEDGTDEEDTRSNFSLGEFADWGNKDF